MIEFFYWNCYHWILIVVGVKSVRRIRESIWIKGVLLIESRNRVLRFFLTSMYFFLHEFLTIYTIFTDFSSWLRMELLFSLSCISHSSHTPSHDNWYNTPFTLHMLTNNNKRIYMHTKTKALKNMHKKKNQNTISDNVAT